MPEPATASSTTPSTATSSDGPFAAPKHLLREPLLHFVALGALLFALDHALVVRNDDPRTIVVGAAADTEARETFRNGRGQDPNAQELAALRRAWLDNELLYREGLAMQVDKGDSMIRERVIFKALSVIDAGLKLPPVDDATLRAWFEARRTKYDEPARFDFQEAALPGEPDEAKVRAFVDQLNGGTPGDARAGLRVFKGRPLANLDQSYGHEFAKALAASTPGEWRALKTRDGWRAMRLESVITARPAEFETVRNVVRQDWVDATMARLRTDAVRRLEQKYTIRLEAAVERARP